MTIDVECPKGGRHELTVITTWSHDARAYCMKCLEHDLLDHEDIERLLNAAIRLTASEAGDRAVALEFEGLTSGQLKPYARAWRGEINV